MLHSSKQVLDAPLERGDAHGFARLPTTEPGDEPAGSHLVRATRLMDGDLERGVLAPAVAVELFESGGRGFEQRTGFDGDGFGQAARIEPFDGADLRRHMHERSRGIRPLFARGTEGSNSLLEDWRGYGSESVGRQGLRE